MSTSLVSVLLLGLLVGGVSCAAVPGALLAGPIFSPPESWIRLARGRVYTGRLTIIEQVNS